MYSPVTSTHRLALMNCLGRGILFLVAKLRLSLFVAILTALSTPRLASAQSVTVTFDASGSSGGTNEKYGNYMFPSGGWSLTPAGGAKAELVSITAELQYLKNGAWTSWNPPLIQTATAGKNTWSADGWQNIQGGFSYRVVAIMTWRQLIPPLDWETKTQPNTDFQRSFP
jgi:hypothetical protein